MRNVRTAVMLLLAACAASPAGAIDSLTGVWTGKFTCGSTSEVATTKGSKADAAFTIEDYGDGTGRAMVSNVSILPFSITIVSGADKPEQARIAGFECGFSTGLGGQLFHATAKVKAGSPKGTLSGEFLSIQGGTALDHFVSVCRFTAKRTATFEGSIDDCPL